MAINASNYALRTTTPSVPRISINVATATVEEVNSAVDAYLTNASDYADAFVNIVTTRDYVQDRLMKDLTVGEAVEGLSKDGVDYVNNTVSIHVKADDLFAMSVDGRTLNTVGIVNSVEENFNEIYSSYYVESGVCVLDTDSAYYTEQTYDTKAYVVGEGGIASAVAADAVFINDVPNAIGDARTYTNYAVVSDVATPQYVISCDGEYEISSGVTERAWVLKEAGESAVIAYATVDDLGAETMWTVQGEEEEEEQSEP